VIFGDSMGFEEIPHTADYAIRAWAPDISSLFAEAARGMNSVSGASIGQGLRLKRPITLQAADLESLLVEFLNELVFAQEQEGLGFDGFDLRISANQLTGMLTGSVLQSLAKPIKAVTYHGLKITDTALGPEVELVFDV
jgi:SHS2 domain-containing protein